MNTDRSDVQWFKSSHSSGQTDCVEVAWLSEYLVGVRDSKNPAAPALAFTLEEWDVFTTGVRGGRFDFSS